MKNLARIFLLPGLGLLLLSSCDKDEDTRTIVSGHVVDAATDAPIANATVGISSFDPWTGGGGSQIALLHTDANGNFTYEFTPESQYAYHYSIDGGDYVPPGWVEIKKFKHNNITTTLTPHSYLKVTVRDTSDEYHNIIFGSFSPGVHNTTFGIDSLMGTYQVPWNETYIIEWATANGTQPIINHTMQVHLTPRAITPVLLEY